MKLYVVATSQKEAEELAESCGHATKREALKDIADKILNAPEYRIYVVRKDD